MPRTPPGLQRMVRRAARPLGFLQIVLGATMVACGLLGKLFQEGWSGVDALGLAALVTIGAGVLLIFVSAPSDTGKLSRREALLVVGLGWLMAGLFGGLPFVFGAGFTFHDAIFEATSGFTTTGATIMTRIEGQLDAPLHLWRLLTHWLGGLGLVVLFVAIFPALGVGGKHLFRSEVPGVRPKGLVPRIRETSSVLWRIYLAVTVLEMALLLMAGLSPLDAIGHAFSTMGTGGYSTLDRSVGGFENLAVEMIILVFMLVAGSNFGLFYDATRRGWRAIIRDTEFRVYVGIFALATVAVALDIWVQKGSIAEAFRYGSFQVAAVMTTTGFGTDDFELYPTFSHVVLISLYFIGGSAGSTAGGMKVIRVVVLAKALAAEVQRNWRPNVVAPVLVGGRPYSAEVIVEVAACCAVFLATFMAGGVLVALLDPVDLTTAFMASLACVANVGPGLGLVGSTDNYGFFSPAVKMILSVIMVLGRLEFFTLLALLNPGFWKR